MIKENIIKSLKEGGCDPAAISPGDTVNVNHHECPAGADRRKRLYVTRKNAPADLVVAYCHNCGDGMGFKYRVSRFHSSYKVASRKPRDVQYEWDQGVPHTSAPTPVVNWLEAKGYDAKNWARGETWIRWHPVKSSLMFGILPEWDLDAGANIDYPRAIQYRDFSGGPAKYLTLKGSEWPQGQPLRSRLFLGTQPSTNIAIVEDILSARKLFSYTEVGDLDVYCLFGASCSIDELAKLRHTHGYRGLLVWLDNDVENVLSSRDDICRRAKLVGFKEVRVEKTRHDPKYYEDSDLTRIFTEYTSA